MDLSAEGFWREWDVQVLNFSLVSLLNILATLFLATLSCFFDFSQLVDVANWGLVDSYIFLGPVAASALTLLMVDSSTWMVNYDFGIKNEQAIYEGIREATVVVQVIGNGSSVSLLGAYVAVTFITLVSAALLLLASLAGLLGLLAFGIFMMFVGFPVTLDVWALLLLWAFILLVLALGFDGAYMLFSEPLTSWPTIEDLFQNGLASTTLREFEDTLETQLGFIFTHLYGTELLQEILDDFWLHAGLQALVVLPLTSLLTIGRALGISFPSLGFGYIIIIVDNLPFVAMDFFAQLDAVPLQALFPEGQISEVYYTLDYNFRLFAHFFSEVEIFYWGIYFLIRLFQRWQSGYYSSGESWFDFELPTWSDLTSWLKLDFFVTSFQDLELMTKLVIVGVLLPLVQILTWAYQIPFFKGMVDHI